MNNKKWSTLLLLCTFGLLAFLGGLTAWIDPFFHYHQPLPQFQYPLDNQRYQNDGIVKNFDYDAIITGTSVTENFKTSQCDALFDCSSVKTSFSGATFAELNQHLSRAIAANPDLKLVIYGLDSWFFLANPDELRTDAAYPHYLYDDNAFNDVNYLLNKEVFLFDTLGVLDYTAAGKTTTTFDEYSSWDAMYTYDGKSALASYQRQPKAPETTAFTPSEGEAIQRNMTSCIVQLANSHPDIQFYYFLPPYSVLYWDELAQTGRLNWQIEAFQQVSQALLGVENLHLFSFYDRYEITEDLTNYRDKVHYSAAINQWILQAMRDGEGQLTQENYQAHWQGLLQHYQSFDFDAFLAQ